jgi:hypothetical protein
MRVRSHFLAHFFLSPFLKLTLECTSRFSLSQVDFTSSLRSAVSMPQLAGRLQPRLPPTPEALPSRRLSSSI